MQLLKSNLNLCYCDGLIKVSGRCRWLWGVWQRELSSGLSWLGCQLSKVAVPSNRRLELHRQHGMRQTGFSPELARIGLYQLRQGNDIPLVASCLAASELPLVTTLQHSDLWAAPRQELSTAQLGLEHIWSQAMDSWASAKNEHVAGRYGESLLLKLQNAQHQ